MTETSPIRVMIVDDHAVVRSGLAAFLLVYDDMELIGEAEGGEEAVRQCKKLQPDVILMDLVMPDMDGAELAGEIRKINAQLPFVLFSSLGMREAETKTGLFSAYLAKPLRQSQLFDTLVTLFAPEKSKSPVKKPGEKPKADPDLAARHPLRILLAEDNCAFILRISPASSAPSISGMCISRIARSKRSPSFSHFSASFGVSVARVSVPHFAVCSANILRLVALSSTISSRLPISSDC